MTISELENFWTSHDTTTVMQKTGLMAVAGILLGMITPYNTYEIPMITGRFLYWVGNIVFASLVSGMVGRLIFSILNKMEVHVVLAFLIFTAALSLPTLFWVASWELILKGIFMNPAGFTYEYVSNSLASLNYGLLGYLSFYLKVWLITLLIVGPVSLIGEKLNRGKKASEVAFPGRRFFDRLPAALGTDVLCLSMEDHYLRVYTSHGDTLLLLRMADAVAELEGYPGMQVHRSWWVAKSAIDRVIREPRKKTILLTNRIQVPISQRREKALREANFI